MSYFEYILCFVFIVDNIIQTALLSKSFKLRRAVNHVSIAVREGEIYGFLGLNGAGKTTTIRMLLGMITPETGEALLFNKKVGLDHSIWNDVGYMVESPAAYPNLTVYENLQVVLYYRRLKETDAIQLIVEKLQLGRFRNTVARELSMGNLQRLGLAKALVHKPKLLILDEPTNGLDPAGIVEVRELLKDLVSSGTTIFISSHILGEISKLATKVGIIHDGSLIHEHDTLQLHERLIHRLIVDTVDNAAAIQLLKSKDVTSNINRNGLISISDSEILKRPEVISQLLAEGGVPPRQLYTYEENLEDYFLRLVGEKQSSE